MSKKTSINWIEFEKYYSSRSYCSILEEEVIVVGVLFNSEHQTVENLNRRSFSFVAQALAVGFEESWLLRNAESTTSQFRKTYLTLASSELREHTLRGLLLQFWLLRERSDPATHIDLTLSTTSQRLNVNKREGGINVCCSLGLNSQLKNQDNWSWGMKM